MVRLGDQDLGGVFRTRKERALLAYLAVENHHPLRREALAELLWPERPEGYARTNLRQALVGLRRVIGEGYVQVTDELIHFKGGNTAWLDVGEFRQAYQRTLSHQHPSLDSCPDCARQLERAVELYRGDFLEEVSLPDSPGFQEWSVFHREQHLRYLLSALGALSDYYKRQRDYETAHQHAWRYVNLAPLEESAHRQVMNVLALSGRRSAAMEQFNTCRSLLARELGVEPAAETLALYELIRSGQLVEPPPSGARLVTGNLPSQLTSFYGRESEMEQLEQCLVNPECRLITLIGMPGAGKTRLAMQAARRKQEYFQDGVWFIDLKEGLPGSGLAERLLYGLGVTVQLAAPALEQLFRQLHKKRCLLVVDRFEGYLGETGLLLEILRREAGVKIMVASQERVNYQSACVIPVGGLPYQSGDDPAEALESPAVQLFLGRARHTRSGFNIESKNLANVTRICRLVEGLPLGVELAASALRELSSEQIAFQLEYDLGVLHTSLQDLPAEQRSMSLALERAWLRLPPELQARLIALAQQAGTFTAEASGASQDELNNLVDSSWLLSVGPGKYRLHHLVRLFAAGRGSVEVPETGPAQTVLPGKGTFIDRLEHLITRAERYGQTAGVVLVSLEEIKLEAVIPDGNTPAGSAPRGVTQAVLRRVASCLRKSDTVALLDRDLLGLVLEDLSRPEDGLRVTQKVCNALSQSLVVESQRYQVSVCMGVSIYPKDAAAAEALIERAGIALRNARQAGECCLMYTEEV